MSAPDISVRNLDHLGLVAAMCDELGIAAMIDTLLPKMHPAKVSHGQAFVAMLLNGEHEKTWGRRKLCRHSVYLPATFIVHRPFG